MSSRWAKIESATHLEIGRACPQRVHMRTAKARAKVAAPTDNTIPNVRPGATVELAAKKSGSENTMGLNWCGL